MGDALTYRLIEVAALVKSKFDLYGLTQGSWTFSFDKCVTRAGCCDHSHRHITISQHLALNIKHPMSAVENTLLHEIAHAIVGMGEGHNLRWRSVAIAIGCDGERCHHFQLVAEKYAIACSVCGALNAMRHRIRHSIWKKASCEACDAPSALVVLSRECWDEISKDT